MSETRHAFVTGAGTGIGAAITKALAQMGLRVSLAGRRRAPLEETAAGLADALVVDDFDVTDPEKIAAGLALARKEHGPVDILVNNAGEAPSAPFGKIALATWNEVLAINLTGTFLVTQAVLADMLARKAGRIVNIASTAGLKGYAYVAAYTAAKHGVVGLTRALALEVAKSGVTVNAVCPGYTDTAIIAAAVDTIVAKSGRSRAEALATFTATNPQGRLVKPAEVADTVLWIVSEGAAAINGQAIAVAGGEVMVG